MSIETVKAFFLQTGSDPALEEKFRSAALESGEAMSRLGREHGYIFTPEDAVAAREYYQSGELSDEDLDLVSGGKVGSQLPMGKAPDRSASE